MKSKNKEFGIMGYIPKARTCSGLCYRCREYKKVNCKGYLQTWTDEERGKILVQIEVPIDLEYINEEFRNDKDIIERSNFNLILGKAFNKMEEEGYILKKEVFKVLENDYDLKLTERSLRNYVVENLIEPPKLDRVKGVTGSVSFYKKNTPALIFLIKWLKKVRAKLTFASLRKIFNLLKLNDREELKKLIECGDLEARIGRLDLIYIGFFMALVELNILKKVNLMSKDEIKKFSFGKLLKDPIADNVFELLDQEKCKITEDYIMIKLNPPIEREVYFREEGIEVAET